MVDGTYIQYTDGDNTITTKVKVTVQHNKTSKAIAFYVDKPNQANELIDGFIIDDDSLVPVWTEYNWASLIEKMIFSANPNSTNKPFENIRVLRLSDNTVARLSPNLGEICLNIQINTKAYFVLTPEHSSQKNTGLKIKKDYEVFDIQLDKKVEYFIITLTSSRLEITPKYVQPDNHIAVDMRSLFGETYSLNYAQSPTPEQIIEVVTTKSINSFIDKVGYQPQEPCLPQLKYLSMGKFRYFQAMRGASITGSFKIAFGKNLANTALLECLSAINLTHSDDPEAKGKRLDLLVNSIPSDQVSDSNVISAAISAYTGFTS